MNREFAYDNTRITQEINRVFQAANGHTVCIEAQYLPKNGLAKDGSFSISAWFDNFPNTEHMLNREIIFQMNDDRLMTLDEVEVVFSKAKEVLEVEEERRLKH